MIKMIFHKIFKKAEVVVSADRIRGAHTNGFKDMRGGAWKR